MNRSIFRLLVISIVLLVGGCAGESSPEVDVRGAGSTFAAPLFNAWIQAYEPVNKAGIIQYDSVGSSEGNSLFLSGDVDFAVSEAPPDASEMSSVKGGGQLLPITSGGIVVAYNNASIPEGLRLSREALADIFLGNITRWDDERISSLNEGKTLPREPIIVVTRADGSGTTFAFTSHLAAISTAWREGPGIGKAIQWPVSGGNGRGNDDQAGAIKRTPGAIGYVQYGIADRAGLGLAVLENRDGQYVAPSIDTMRSAFDQEQIQSDFRISHPDPEGANAYPIVTLVWALIPESFPASDRNVDAVPFLNWCLTTGQSEVERLGYVPLPNKMLDMATIALEKSKN